MPINMTIHVQGSVGSGGRNQPNDVRAVQQQLNDQSTPPRVKLVVDGKSGPKTVSMIRDFQSVVVGMRNPDGRVDPNGKTLAALNTPDSNQTWARMSIGAPATVGGGGGAGGSGASLLESQATGADDQAALQEMRQFLIDSALPVAKGILTGISTAQEARILLDAWKWLRGLRISAPDAVRVIAWIKRKEAATGKALLADVFKPTSRFGQGLSRVASVAGGAEILLTAFEVGDKIGRAQYGDAAADLYKLFIGRRFPWVGVIDGLQSMVEEILPPSVQVTGVFRVLRAFDPAGLGGVGVDAIVTVSLGAIEMIRTRKMNLAQLQQLVSRMQSGPAAFFAKAGDELGASIHEMTRWRTGDLTYAISRVPGFILDALPRPWSWWSQ